MAFLWRKERPVEVPGTGVRVLSPHEWGLALEVCERWGSDGTLAYAHIVDAMSSRAPVGEAWGRWEDGDLRSVCWAGGNIEPVGVTAQEAHVYAELAQMRRARYSLVGNADAVLGMWGVLEKSWSARELRRDQPLMEIARPALVEADPETRQGRPDELERVFPAAVAMFTEEVGVSPLAWAESYKQRVLGLLERGNTYVRLTGDGSRVLFKADLGARAGRRAQIQGVWTDPEHRGRGLCTHGLAALVDHSLTQGISSLSLYVNDYNVAARTAYEKIGFTTVGHWATVML
jgi:predicted GNAT family acetyltransferase